MSENLDLVRSIYAGWERGDFSSVEWAQPGIEFVMGDGPDPGTFMGVAAMAAFWRKFLRAWKRYSVEADEYRELDDERVLVLLHAVGRGHDSGLALWQGGETSANIFQISEGKVTRLVIYFDCDRAFADLGLEE